MGLDWRRFLVAQDEQGNLVGCGQVKTHRDGSRELASIAVVKAWRKQGVARAIIERLMADNPPPLWLTCHSPLIPLYEKFGFREVTAVHNMPPYFGRVKRLSGLFLYLAKTEGYLAVMVWESPPLAAFY
jgi:GNAT superfamily N-acetyltransferase